MAFSPAARAWRDGGGDPAARLLLLCADPLDTLDREGGPATFLGNRTEPMATSGQLLVPRLVCTENSDSDIMVMQSAKDRVGVDTSSSLN